MQGAGSVFLQTHMKSAKFRPDFDILDDRISKAALTWVSHGVTHVLMRYMCLTPTHPATIQTHRQLQNFLQRSLGHEARKRLTCLLPANCTRAARLLLSLRPETGYA